VPSAVFDQMAARYDDLWTNTAVGGAQREAVWRRIIPLYRRGETILDLGCGTGEDAIYLERAGVMVRGLDASPEMVHAARHRGVAASVLRIEELDRLSGSFDGALSNFGALNCLEDIEILREPLGRLVRTGGYFAACVMGRFCLWETAYYLGRGKLRQAGRRWRGIARGESLGLPVFYPTIRQIRKSLAPEFVLKQSFGIGVCVPPSYVRGFTGRAVTRLDALDRRIAHRAWARAVSDHRLLILVRS